MIKLSVKEIYYKYRSLIKYNNYLINLETQYLS